jgi:hypothetical protein
VKYLNTGAAFSSDRKYRYALWRQWDESLPYMMSVGLNPSTADEKQDDPTIRRVVHFAQRENCGGLFMLNLFAFRATDPKTMLAASDPIGSENDRFLREYQIASAKTVLGWGNHGAYMDRSTKVALMLSAPLHCFGLTKAREPKHPLYLSNESPLVLYEHTAVIQKWSGRNESVVQR